VTSYIGLRHSPPCARPAEPQAPLDASRVNDIVVTPMLLPVRTGSSITWVRLFQSECRGAGRLVPVVPGVRFAGALAGPGGHVGGALAWLGRAG